MSFTHICEQSLASLSSQTLINAEKYILFGINIGNIGMKGILVWVVAPGKVKEGAVPVEEVVLVAADDAVVVAVGDGTDVAVADDTEIIANKIMVR